MKFNLPKIVTEKRIDQSIESRDVKKELKRRKRVRRKMRSQSNLTFQTSKFPQAYGYGDRPEEEPTVIDKPIKIHKVESQIKIVDCMEK